MNKRTILPISLVLLAPFCYLLSRYNYALFHLTIEFFTVTIGIMIFSIGIISQRYTANTILERFGYGLLTVSLLTFLHAVTYKGMNILGDFGVNTATQFWVALNIIQAISLLLAIFLENIKINKWIFIIFYLFLGIIFTILSFTGLFPVCFVEGAGLTPFKIISEYIVIIIYIICLILLNQKKNDKATKIFMLSILLLIIADFAFTLYSDVYGIQNFIGHYFRLIGLCVMFIIIVVTNIQKPYESVFKNLKILSEKDGLTKLYNRNYLNQFLTTFEQKDHDKMFMVLFDVDNFKYVNDNFGHDLGDIVLQEVSEIMQRNIRINDMAIRFGGDEFLIIFTRTTAEDAKKSWERVNIEINRHNFTSKQIRLTVCAGFGIYNGDFEKTYKEIDSIILEEKKSGKNQTRYNIN